MKTNFLNNLELDRWWKGVLWAGFFILAMSFLPVPEFLVNKYVFGFGLGLIFIGFSFWIAEKRNSYIKPPNVYTGGTALITEYRIEHNIITILLLIAGIIITGMFAFLLVKSLI